MRVGEMEKGAGDRNRKGNGKKGKRGKKIQKW